MITKDNEVEIAKLNLELNIRNHVQEFYTETNQNLRNGTKWKSVIEIMSKLLEEYRLT